MNIITNKYIITLVNFFLLSAAFAAPNPPAPLPPPPGLPIDNGSVILIFIVIIYSLYIFKFKKA